MSSEKGGDSGATEEPPTHPVLESSQGEMRSFLKGRLIGTSSHERGTERGHVCLTLVHSTYIGTASSVPGTGVAEENRAEKSLTLTLLSFRAWETQSKEIMSIQDNVTTGLGQ